MHPGLSVAHLVLWWVLAIFTLRKKSMKTPEAEIGRDCTDFWCNRNKMALDPSERWIYRVISVSCTQLSLPNMPFFFSFITFFFSVSLHSFSFHPRFFVFSVSFFASLPKRVLPCSLFECFSFSGCSGWKVRDVRVKSTSLLLCVCVCVCESVHMRERAELLKWDWSIGSSWEG